MKLLIIERVLQLRRNHSAECWFWWQLCWNMITEFCCANLLFGVEGLISTVPGRITYSYGGITQLHRIAHFGYYIAGAGKKHLYLLVVGHYWWLRNYYLLKGNGSINIWSQTVFVWNSPGRSWWFERGRWTVRWTVNTITVDVV